MRLAWKLIVAVTVCVMVVMTVYGWLRVQRESGMFESDMRRDHRTTGRAVAALLKPSADRMGDAATAELVGQAGHQNPGLRLDLVWPGAEAVRAELGPEISSRLLEDEEVIGEDIGEDMVSLVPFRTKSGRLGAVRIRESQSQERRYIRITVLRFLATGLTLTLVCAVVVAFFVVRFIARPLNQLVAQARRVGGGDFSLRLTLSQRDEMAELAREMNVMCDELDTAQKRVAQETAQRIATLEQLRHADRLTTVGKLASGVAHELGTPLNVVLGRAKLILDEPGASKEVAHGAKVIHEQAERMTKIIRQLLDFARRRGPRKERVDLTELAARTASLLESLAKKSGVSFAIAPEGAPPTEADASAIQQVFTNLFINAIQAMPEGGTLSVEVANARRAPPVAVGGGEREWTVVRVTDTGKGMTGDVLEHVFEPFFTTKDVGEGTGLGLSVSYGIVSDHGGFIEVESQAGQGSRFAVFLPTQGE